jgi:hypothetical protein
VSRERSLIHDKKGGGGGGAASKPDTRKSHNSVGLRTAQLKQPLSFTQYREAPLSCFKPI